MITAHTSVFIVFVCAAQKPLHKPSLLELGQLRVNSPMSQWDMLD